MLSAKTSDSAAAPPGPLPRQQQRRPDAQDDDREHLRMAAAARAIGHDALARTLLEQRRHDPPGVAPAPGRNVSLASSTPEARVR